MSDMRLQKFLAERGIASRRHAATLIREGRVQVDGSTVTEPGFRIAPDHAAVSVDGARVPTMREPARTIMLNKPPGYVCSTTARRAPTVYALLKGIEERLVPVGRLDRDSEGLLLMSNDGELINRITHPRHGHRKTYEVTVAGDLSERQLRTLRSRLVIDGYRIQPARVRRLRTDEASMVLEFVLVEGRNRQIRKMCEKAALRVTRLVRTAVGAMALGELATGHWRPLTESEIRELRKA